MKKKKNRKQKMATQISREERRYLQNKEDIKVFLEKLLLFVIVLFVLFRVVFGITPMKDYSMHPRISLRDLMVYYRLNRNYQVSDVALREKDGVLYVGRVIVKGGVQAGKAESVQELQSLKAVIYKDDSYRRESPDQTGITVTGKLPTGAVVKAYPVTLKDETKRYCLPTISLFLIETEMKFNRLNRELPFPLRASN